MLNVSYISIKLLWGSNVHPQINVFLKEDGPSISLRALIPIKIYFLFNNYLYKFTIFFVLIDSNNCNDNSIQEKNLTRAFWSQDVKKRDFPGVPVVKTPCGFDPWSGEARPKK